MAEITNPYLPSRPVDRPELFFGRRELLSSLREQLLKGRRLFVVTGPPRVGKSSFLLQLPAQLPEQFVCVRMDLQSENAHSLDWLLWRLAQLIDEQMVCQLGSKARKPAWSDFEGNPDQLLTRFWPGIHKDLNGRCLVLILDNLSRLTQGTAKLLDPFLLALAAWREHNRDAAVMMAMSVTEQQEWARAYPSLFGGALDYVLGPLSSEEATRLITWPVEGAIAFDQGVARRLIEISSGQPYYLQLLCAEVFDRCSRAGWVTHRDVDLVVDSLVHREIPEFRQVWEESSAPEQVVLAALVSMRGARGIATAQEVHTELTKAGARPARDQTEAVLNNLAARGIVEQLGALSYRFRVALLRDWLSKRIDLRDVVRQARGATGEHRMVQPPAAVRDLRVGQSTAPQAAAAAQEQTQPLNGQRHPGASRTSRLWPALVGVVGLGVLVAAALILRSGPAVQSLATFTTSPVATAQPTPVTSSAVAEIPSVTPTLRPTATPRPSPTPPLVMARSLPAIAFQSRGPGDNRWAIYLMDSDGSNRFLLADGQAGFLAPPAWSPDGTRIAFVSDRDGNDDIWVAYTDGSGQVNLTHHEAKDHSPAWSPDGEWIAFASVRDSIYWELYLMRSDGSNVRRLTWWEDASDLSPAWSPDGARLAFASKRDGNWELYAMDRNGANLVRLTYHPADDTNPSWSPDGKRLAFESTRDGYAEIYVMLAVGGEATNVSREPFASDHGPTWSPDGNRIAFYSDRDGEWDVYSMASDGSDVLKLTSDSTNDQVPSWRP